MMNVLYVPITVMLMEIVQTALALSRVPVTLATQAMAPYAQVTLLGFCL